tara:strand:- start:676 stop:927 length:252 start_codon:yes stop_codon:yes gene_type:complete
MAYNKTYYNLNSEHIKSYNKIRRESNPKIKESEKKSYQLNTENYKLRSKIQHLKGKMAWEMLSKAKKQLVLAEISEKLGVDVK